MRVFLLSLLLAVGAGLATANTVSYTVTPEGGQFLYEFSLQNSGASGGPIYDLFLLLPMDISNIDTATIGMPTGWGDATGGLLFFGPDVNPSTTFIQWAADFSGLYDLAVGESLTEFSFRSTIVATGPITFALNGSTELETAQETAAVPEPSTVGLVLIGLVLTPVCWFRRVVQ